MRVPALLEEQALADAHVGLPQLDALGLGLLHQPLPRSLVEPSVGGEAHVLLLHGGVHVHALELTHLHQLQAQARLDGFLQELLGAGLADAPPPAGHARGVDRQPMLEELHARQVLPVGVLQPAGQHLLIAQIEGVLQVVQRHHQTRRHTRPAHTLGVGDAERLLEPRPVHLVGETHQRVTAIHHVDQLHAEEVPLRILARAIRWPHIS